MRTVKFVNIVFFRQQLPLPKIRVKICGITNNDDALLATSAGADALGLVLYAPSKRAVQLAKVQEILANIPVDVARVALFVDAKCDEVNNAVATGAFTLLQFHGAESPEYCESFGLPYLKALRVPADQAMGRAERRRFSAQIEGQAQRYHSAEMILLDSSIKGQSGGTGQSFDWTLLDGLSSDLRSRLLLAGGLNSANVAEAISTAAPYGVDVSSGLEASPGKKDPALLKAFFEQLPARR